MSPKTMSSDAGIESLEESLEQTDKTYVRSLLSLFEYPKKTKDLQSTDGSLLQVLVD